MSLPGNGLFAVQGEMTMLVTAMRRSIRKSPNEEYDLLMRTFQDLKILLSQVDDLRLLDPSTYLSPFLEVIRSKETTGPVTSLALSALQKFLSYGLIDPTHPSVPVVVEDIADAVVHARFVGTDRSSDGMVLMKIQQVLRTLILSPEGVMLTDESVCEIMLSCFRICFETRLSELLRFSAEQCLRDMAQLIFSRVPQFPVTPWRYAADMSLTKRDHAAKRKALHVPYGTNSLERNSSAVESSADKTDNGPDTEASKAESLRLSQDKNLINEAEITIEPLDDDHTHNHTIHSSKELATSNTSINQILEKPGDTEHMDGESNEENKDEPHLEEDSTSAKDLESIRTEKEDPDSISTRKDEPRVETEESKPEEYVNHLGIRFTPQEAQVELQPYGLDCVRVLFKFIISLCNPSEAASASGMVQLGLSLAAAALELAPAAPPRCAHLTALIADPLARNLLTLLDTERISIFALDLQVSFLLFESMRYHLKYQMEAFFKKIIENLSADTTKSIYELKEIHHLALESLIQFFRIPGFCTELYLNYDCDVYCMNVFEELTKLLSKNVVSSTAYNLHQLSLEALLTIMEAIEVGSQQAKDMEIEESVQEQEDKFGRAGHVTLELGGLDEGSVSSEPATHDISQYARGARRDPRPHADAPTEAELDNIRNIKKWVSQGTELFNQKPERGIEFLQQHGVLDTPLDPHQVAMFLRENPDLDKKMIGEYICKRSSRDEPEDGTSVLTAFADSFDYHGLRIEQALRMYLETFRLPGEAPLIFLVMERFAERWHSTNGFPFANTDAAFRLAYAVIMLNMDQHNHNAKKLNVPMTVEDFVKNLRGCNGSGDFDQKMLEEVFHSIKNEEMVMPAERVGPVRDAYLWRVLQRRGAAPGARYRAPPPHSHHARLFAALCPPALLALSAAFERAAPPTPEEVSSNNTRDSTALLALQGLERAAALVARLPADTITVDTVLLTLCKFTGLLTPQHPAYIAIGVSLGQSAKAMASLSRAATVAARHAHAVRAAWRHLLEVLHTLYQGRLLPKCLVEAEDYLSPSGSVSLQRDTARGDSSILSSIYSYIALGETGMRAPTPHEKALIDAAAECVARCNFPALLVTETKFLPVDSLQELVRAMISAGTPPDADSAQLNPQLEDITIFYMELLCQTLIQNRDRLTCVWDEAGPHLRRVVWWSANTTPALLTRTVTALLRTAARLMRCDVCAPLVLQHLTLLFALPYKLFYQQAVVVSYGLYELVKTSAQNVHSAAEWDTVFALLCAAGAGAWPKQRPAPLTPANSASSRSEGSDEESDRRPQSAASESELSHSPQTQGWILVKNEPASAVLEPAEVTFRAHRTAALSRCCEALALVLRDVAHVTPHNCRAAVRCVRVFARAAQHAGKKCQGGSSGGRGARRRADDDADEQDHYHRISIQLLDLMHTLHSRTAQIYKWWHDEAPHDGAEEYDLWEVAWMPLLQGIAEFCTDTRKQVVNNALEYLQRALLVPALAGMGGARWLACFTRVLFPLLERLPRRADPAARANTIMCKVFLQHLSALSGTGAVGAVWARVVAVQRALAAARDDPLTEAAQESLKNMILVMDSVRIFSNADGYNDLWYMTWSTIGEFLPNLKEELFPGVQDNSSSASLLPGHMLLPPSLPTILPVGMPSPAPHTQHIPQTSPPLQNTHNPIHPSYAQGSHNSPQTSPTLGQKAPNVPSPNFNQNVNSVHSAFVQNARTYPTLVQTTQTLSQTSPTLVQNSHTSPTLSQTLSHTSPTFLQTSQSLPHTSPTLLATSPVNITQTPPQISSSPCLVAPTPISGMVPIRNPLYDQPPLTSSVLLQPLNEMKSTPIGVSIQSQMPILYRREPPSKPEPSAPLIESKNALLDLNYEPPLELQQRELYAEYLTNPYEVKGENQTLISGVEKQKSFSANATPMHRNKAQFGSTDNVRQDSSMFNFSSYFGSNEKGSEVFDSLMATHEG